MTRGRARGPDPSVVSHEEREEMEVRGRQPFRANPVPPRVLGPKPMGLPHVQPAKPVIPESPAFALKQRMESRKRRPGNYAESMNHVTRPGIAKLLLQ